MAKNRKPATTRMEQDLAKYKALMIGYNEAVLELRGGREDSPLRSLYGDAEFEELRALLLAESSNEAETRFWRSGPQVILLPGIMGSHLSKGRSWIWVNPIGIRKGGMKRLAYPEKSPKVEPSGVILMTYLKTRLYLQMKGFRVSYYPYDWRVPLDELGEQFIRHLKSFEDGGVLLAAHSMGGLVARAAMAHDSKTFDAKVKRAVMLGTPNQGSFVPLAVYEQKYPLLEWIEWLDPKTDMATLIKKVIATFPGLCNMMPFKGAHFADEIYDPAFWKNHASGLRAAMLDESATIQRKLAEVHGDDRFRIIAGVNVRTPVKLNKSNEELIFEEDNAGDGTVPLISAELEGNGQTYYADGIGHGDLPHSRAVLPALVDLLRDGSTSRLPSQRPDIKPGSWKRNVNDLVEAPCSPLRSPVLYDVEAALFHFARLSKAEGLAEIELESPTAPGMIGSIIDGPVLPHFRRRVDLKLVRGDISTVETETVVLGVFPHVRPTGAARAIDQHLGGLIEDLFTSRQFSGNIGEVFPIPLKRRSLRAETILLAGLGNFNECTLNTVRTTAESAFRFLARTGTSEAATTLLGSSLHEVGDSIDLDSMFNAFMDGFLGGLRGADSNMRFRSLIICELREEMYHQLIESAKKYRSQQGCFDLELTISLGELPAIPLLPELRDIAPRTSELDPYYLMIKTIPRGGAGKEIVYNQSVLGPRTSATVLERECVVKIKQADELGRILENGSADEAGVQLADLVLHDDIKNALGQFKTHPFVIIHDAEASRLPWEGLKIGSNFPAVEGGLSRRLTTIDQNVSTWIPKESNATTLNILLIGNPTEDLSGADAEVKEIIEQIKKLEGRGATVLHLSKGEASRDTILRTLGHKEFDIVHYAGHAKFDSKMPERSGILCHGGELITARDLRSIGRAPMLAVFNACESARVRRDNRERIGKKSMRSLIPVYAKSFAQAWLEGGVSNYIGTFWPVGDHEAAVFATAFYGELLAGRAIGHAVLQGRIAIKKDPKSSNDWLNYQHFGDPKTQIFRENESQ
jgi:CHAT domain-containing protein/pimeloyl-ACP methyl ester carboxylesterase